MVRPSLVVTYGTPRAPTATVRTLQSLYYRKQHQHRFQIKIKKTNLGLLRLDGVNGKAALGVVKKAEVLVRLLDRDDVHEASRVVHVSANLAIDLDEALEHNGGHLAARERILEAVTQKHNQGERLAALVGASRGLGGLYDRASDHRRPVLKQTYPGAAHLVKHPVLGRIKALKVLLRPARLREGCTVSGWMHRGELGDRMDTPSTQAQSSRAGLETRKIIHER